MTVQFNHTIVWCTDQTKSARYLADTLGLEAPRRYAGFDIVDTDNELSLDFRTTTGDFARQHYAFLVSESEFDEIFARIVSGGSEYWADPRRSEPGEINHHDGGRGVYWSDPDGHLLEIITVPYGGASPVTA